jgi:hypothetical protein
MKTFRKFLEEAYLVEMRKEDKVKGRKKTPLYVNPERNVVRKSPEGKWKKTSVKRFAGKGIINPEVSLARMKRPSTNASVGLSGYMSSPQDPGRPQPHGTSGGVSGLLRGVRQRGRRDRNDPIGDPSSPLTKIFHQTPAQKVERRKQRAKSRLGGGYDYKTGRIG